MAYPIAQSPKQNELKRIKKNIDESRGYFEQNNIRWHEFRKFIFKSTLTQDEINNLLDLQKPVLEFNVLEAYLSRLTGEFIKQEPSIEVQSNQDHPVQNDVQTVNVVDGILRAILDEAKRKGQTIEVYRDLASGGFSVFELYPEYEKYKSFDQIFRLRRVYDPTLTGFDPLAEEPTKADGNYCYKLYPRLIDEIKSDYPKANLDNLHFARNLDGYSWCYYNQKNQKIVLLAEYYEKKKKSIKIHRLPNNVVVTDKQYQRLLELISERKMIIVPPKIIESRDSEEVTICRYTLIDNQILEYVETDYVSFPLIFVDGNSVMLRASPDAPVEQMTRPYFYNARDTQRLKNFAGQTLANELENMIQHKFMVQEEAIPPKYRGAYEDIQHADILVHKAYADNDPNKPLAPPQVIPRVPTPPEVTNTFTLADSMTQNILGSFDLSIGKLNDTQLSGLAIQETITQSNATAMPMLNGYILALNHICQFLVDMLPKIAVNKRNIGIVNSEGKRGYARINDKEDPTSVKLDYPENTLNVHVEAGLNFAMQKSRTMSQIIAMMQASPLFAQFMNQKGLRILIDNLDEIRGIDQLKMLADQFMQQLNQQQDMQMQAQLQQMKQGVQANPMVQLKQQQLQMENQHHQDEMQIKMAEIQNDQQQLQNERLKIAIDSETAKNDMLVQADKAQAEREKATVEAMAKVHDQALKHSDQIHTHNKDMAEFSHNIHVSNQQMKQKEVNNNG